MSENLGHPKRKDTILSRFVTNQIKQSLLWLVQKINNELEYYTIFKTNSKLNTLNKKGIY